MEQKNPFSKSRKERKVIDAGIYPATLVTVKTVQVTDKKTNEKRDKLLFSFYVPEKDAEIAAFFWPSCTDNAHIVKFLKATCGDAFTPAIQSDPEKMWQFINGLVGKDFSIVVTLSNGWNNITAAMIAKQATPQPKVEPEALTDEDLFEFSDGMVNL
jgi:hypothetical protein